MVIFTALHHYSILSAFCAVYRKIRGKTYAFAGVSSKKDNGTSGETCAGCGFFVPLMCRKSPDTA
jgi:hypothetical protein